MLILTNPGTADKIQLDTSSAADLACYVGWVDVIVGTSSTPGRTHTAVASAANDQDILAGPASGTQRVVKHINIRNKHASTSNTVTIKIDANGTDLELHKVTLLAGDVLEYQEGIGWFVITSAAKLDTKLRVGSDVINATTSFADVTGLTCAVKNGKQYNFEAHLYHLGNSTATGARFGIGGVAMTSMRINQIDINLASLTAATISSPTSDVTAIDTAAAAETASSITAILCILSGWFNPSADGTFAVRCASEVAVAAGLTIKTGSWARVWEADN